MKAAYSDGTVDQMRVQPSLGNWVEHAAEVLQCDGSVQQRDDGCMSVQPTLMQQG